MLCGDVIWPIIQRIIEMDSSGFISLSTTTTDLTESEPSAQSPCSPPNTATASFALKEPFVQFQPSGATLLPPAPSGPRPGCSLRRPSPWQLPSIQHPQIMKTIDIGECRPLEYCCSKLDTAVAQVHSDKVAFWRISETLRGEKNPTMPQVAILIKWCQRKSRKRTDRTVGSFSWLWFVAQQAKRGVVPPQLFLYLLQQQHSFIFFKHVASCFISWQTVFRTRTRCSAEFTCLLERKCHHCINAETRQRMKKKKKQNKNFYCVTIM